MAYDSASLALFNLSAATLQPAVLCAMLLAALPAQAQEVQEQGHRAHLTELRDFGKLAAPEVRLIGWNADGPLLSFPGRGSATGGSSASQWMRLDFNQPATVAQEWQLELTDGSILVGRPAGGSADVLEWAIGDGANLQLIPVDLLWVRKLSRRQLPPAADQEHDLLVLATPQGGLDRRRGWLEEITPDGVGFLEGDVVVSHPWERIQALRLLEEESDEEIEAGAWLHWRNGSVWAVQPLRLEDDTFVVRTPWQSRISVPMSHVAALDRRQGPFQELAESKAIKFTSPESSVLDWSPKMGRSVEGRRMTLSNTQPVVGWGVKAPTRMEWRVADKGVFTSWVGVDLEVMSHRERAPLEFRVLLDGVVLASSGPVIAGQAPTALRAEIPHAGRLELDVKPMGSKQSGGGHGNWVLPRVWN